MKATKEYTSAKNKMFSKLGLNETNKLSFSDYENIIAYTQKKIDTLENKGLCFGEKYFALLALCQKYFDDMYSNFENELMSKMI